MFRVLTVISVLVSLIVIFAGHVDAAGHNIDTGVGEVAPPQSQPAEGNNEAGAGEEAAPTGFGSSGMIMLLLMLAFMYFVLIRPQGKEQKRRKNMMSAIKVTLPPTSDVPPPTLVLAEYQNNPFHPFYIKDNP